MFQIISDQFSETLSVSDLEDMRRINQYNSIPKKNDDSTKDEHVINSDSPKPI